MVFQNIFYRWSETFEIGFPTLFFESHATFEAFTEKHHVRPHVCMEGKKRTLRLFLLYKNLRTEHTDDSTVN